MNNTPNNQPEDFMQTEKAFAELERGAFAALETYSNVHRGSGHNSMVTTHLFEQAREIVLNFMGLNKSKYHLIFCNTRRAAILIKKLKLNSYQLISSHDIGLSIGISALAVKKSALPWGIPFQSGGGTAKLISKEWVIWAAAPDKFEAGTPAIINAIVFARALKLIKKSGIDIFKGSVSEKLTAFEILNHDELEKYSGRKLLDELRQKWIGKDILVPTVEGNKPFINLDNSASTPTFTPIWNAFRQTLHQSEAIKQDVIQEVKNICSKVFGAPLTDFDIKFTSNATEAINMAAESLHLDSDKDTECVVLNTLLEHSSNDLPWRMMNNNSLIRLGVDEDGIINLVELETILCAYNQKAEHGKKQIMLVAVSGASNVLGICNKLSEISQIVHRYGAKLLVDGAQLVAHRQINMELSGIDYLAFSAHKIYAPFGCGVLIVRKGLLNFSPDEMELIQASGEENVGGIAALGKSLLLLHRIGMDVINEEEQTLTKLALQGLKQIEGITIHGVQNAESNNFANKLGVIAFNHKRIFSNQMAKELAIIGGIGVRYGCHCAHIIVKHILKVSPNLEKFQRVMQSLFPKLRLPGVARMSLGIENTQKDIDKMIEVVNFICIKPNDSHHNKTHILSKDEVKKQMKDFVNNSTSKVYTITY